MTSNINANNIDATFPVAGVDNDSQGFRTNFTNIKNNLAYAKTEIGELQDKVILKSGLLTNGSTLDNSMAGALLSGAEYKDFRETEYDHGTTSGTVVLSHLNGHYQRATSSGNITLSFSNLPAAVKIGRIKFEITVASTAYTLTFPSSVSLGTQGIAGYDATTYTVTFSETGTYIFEFTTDDAGTTIHVNDLSRSRVYFHDDYIRLVGRTITDDRGASGDIAGMIVADTSTPALWLCTGTYDGTTVIWRKAELESPSNEITLKSNHYVTSGSLTTIGSGYTVTPNTNFSFVGDPNTRYSFEAYLPFSHNNSSTSTHVFDVSFTGGAECAAIIQQQAAPTSAYTNNTVTTSESSVSSVVSTSTSTKFARISGTFYSPAAPAAQRTLTIKASTASGSSPNLNIQAGGYIKFTRV